MFGRFPNDETLGRDYLIIPATRKLGLGYEEICSTPMEAREVIHELLVDAHHDGVEENYAIYELVEFATVADGDDGGVEVIFSEDDYPEEYWEEDIFEDE